MTLHLLIVWIMTCLEVWIQKERLIIQKGIWLLGCKCYNDINIYRYEELISRIVVWSTVPQESALQHLNQLASSIRGVGRLPRGSLVLVRVENNDSEKTTSLEDHKWVYGRVAGKAEGSLILLYLTPEESLVVSFEVDKVIPVAPEMCKKYFGEDGFSCVRISLKSIFWIFMCLYFI